MTKKHFIAIAAIFKNEIDAATAARHLSERAPKLDRDNAAAATGW